MIPKWIAKVGGDTAIGLLPRCGIHSIREALGSNIEEVDNLRALSTYTRRVFFIRNPVERVKSSYSMMRWLLENGVSYHGEAQPIAGLPEFAVNWESFIDYMLLNHDSHWSPQASALYHNSTFIPTIVARFERLTELWLNYDDKPIGQENSYPRPTDIDTNYRREELLAIYGEDLALWKAAPAV